MKTYSLYLYIFKEGSKERRYLFIKDSFSKLEKEEILVDIHLY